VYIENMGSGDFKIKPLPVFAQISTVNGMLPTDVNGDQFIDLMLVGNDFGNEVFIGRRDAQTGLLLLGDGKGNFLECRTVESGFLADKNAKSIVRFSVNSEETFLVTRNRESMLKFIKSNSSKRIFKPEPGDQKVRITYKSGSSEKLELYYGSGYLAQSSRDVYLSENVIKLEVTDFSGAKRTIEVQ